MNMQSPSPSGRGRTPGRRHTSGGLATTFGFPVALIVTAMLCGCKRPAVAVLPPPIVVVMEVVPTDVPLSATLIGNLDSPQNVEVRARVEAFVDDMHFTEGKDVTKGELLFVLDKKPYLEKLGAAKGSLVEAEAAVAKYQADVNRLTPLVEKRAVPQQDLDNSKASLDMGKANVITAQSRVETAVLNLSYCDVLAPIAGRIGAKQVSIGDLVGRGDPTLLATISKLDPIWFYCNVSEVGYRNAMARGDEADDKDVKDVMKMPLTLILSNGEEHPYKGKFMFIDRAVNVKTATMRIRAEFPNPDKDEKTGKAKEPLRPGMFARTRVDVGTLRNCLEVPERAITELQGKTFLWVIDKEGKAHQRPVRVGKQNGSNFIISNGIEAGERVVVEGLQKVREGIPVKALSAAQLAAMQAAPDAAAKPAKE